MAESVFCKCNVYDHVTSYISLVSCIISVPLQSYRQRKKKEPIKQKERESAQRCLEKRHKLSQHLLV